MGEQQDKRWDNNRKSVGRTVGTLMAKQYNIFGFGKHFETRLENRREIVGTVENTSGQQEDTCRENTTEKVWKTVGTTLGKQYKQSQENSRKHAGKTV